MFVVATTAMSQLPERKSCTALASATMLAEQAVSMTVDGPVKSNKNEIRFANNAFDEPYTQNAASLARISLKSSCGIASAFAEKKCKIHKII